MTPQQIIDEARVIISDDNALMPERFSDADMLGFVNQSIKTACTVRPDLFITNGTVTPTANQVEQELPAAVTRLMELHRVVGGGALGEVDKQTMDRSAPTWTTETAGTPVNWMRHPRNPRRYYLYPAPQTGTTIAAEYVQVPADYALGDTIALPDSYKTAIIHSVVGIAEFVDNEHVMTERAKAFFDTFIQSMQADYAQRALIDREDGAVGMTEARRGNNG